MIGRRAITGTTVIALVLMAGAAWSADAGVRMEGDFPFTAEDEQQCGTELHLIRSAQYAAGEARSRGYPSDEFERRVREYRASFVSCVETFRVRDRASKEARREAAERIAIEKQKKAEEIKARQEYESQLNAAAQAIADTPKAAQGIFSALLCNALSDRAATLAELARDRKYSRIGGAVNLSRRAEIQDDIAAEDDLITRFKAKLRDLKRPALGCKVPAVARLATCLSNDPDDADPECATPAGLAMARASQMLAPQ